MIRNNQLWLWCHAAGSHDGMYNLPVPSTITPAEAAEWLGIRNAIMVRFKNQPEPPFLPHAKPMAHLDQLVWSIVGDSATTDNDEASDLDAVLELAAQQPNVTGAMMDDFFYGGRKPDGAEARHSLEAVKGFRNRLHAANLDLWLVVYDLLLDRPGIQPYIAEADRLTFWTWKSENLAELEANFGRFEAMTSPHHTKLLGCYMWDYGADQPMPLERMQHQLELGSQWLAEGRIDGMVFLANCLCDLNINTVNWTRNWIAEQS